LYRVPGTQYQVPGTEYRFDIRLLGAALASLFIASSVLAAPPKLTSLFPAGGQRGTTVAVTAAGEFSPWPVQVWADRPGVTAAAENGKGKLKVEIAADAIPGTYWLRLFNDDGASVLRPFIVGTLAEVAESESNDLPEKPQTVEPRVVVNGKLSKSGDVDGYRVELNAGQTLVASLTGNSLLGAPMDAAMQVCELVERLPGKPEAFVLAHNHDAIGLDPQIAFTAAKDGAYLVRLFAFPAQPDSGVRFAGGEDYQYRLTLTTGPYIDHALPLAAPVEETQVALGGWNLGDTKTVIMPPLTADADPLTPPDGSLAWAWHRDAAGAFPLTRAAATRIDLATISGRLGAPGEFHTHPFTAVKSEKLRIRAAAKALGFPTDCTIAVLDSAGKMLAEADDTGRDDRDPSLEFTSPADGEYKVTVSDLAGRGGLRMLYRLSIERVVPDFSLSLAADSFVLERDKPLEIAVNVAARDGFREPIEIHVVGLPPGVTAEPVKFEPTGDAPMAQSGGRRGRGKSKAPASGGPSAKLILKADPAVVQAGGTAIRIEGRTRGDEPIIRSARFNLNLPLAGQHHAAWLTVK
jgi:hypothetical protein